MVQRSDLWPVAGLLALACSTHAADDLNLQVHGFASQGYLLTRNDAFFTPVSLDKGTFEFDEIGLNVVATPADGLRIGIQIFAQDLGDEFNNQPQIDWAYGDYRLPSAGPLDLAVTAGRLKTGHGLYNDYRDLDLTRTSVFLPMSVYNPRLRDYVIAVNGAAVHGTLHGGGLGALDFVAFAGGQNTSPGQGTVHDLFADGGLNLDSLHIERVDGGNLTWNSPIEGLRFKYSLLGVWGMLASGTVRAGGPLPFITGTRASMQFNHIWDNIASVEYQTGDVTLAAEAEYWYLKGLITGDVGIPISFASYQVIHAAYLSASWRFAAKWEAQGICQWSEQDTVAQAKSTMHGFTAALQYDPVDHWILKGEYTWMQGTSPLRAAEQPDGTLERTWGYLALKTTFDF